MERTGWRICSLSTSLHRDTLWIRFITSATMSDFICPRVYFICKRDCSCFYGTMPFGHPMGLFYKARNLFLCFSPPHPTGDREWVAAWGFVASWVGLNQDTDIYAQLSTLVSLNPASIRQQGLIQWLPFKCTAGRCKHCFPASLCPQVWALCGFRVTAKRLAVQTKRKSWPEKLIKPWSEKLWSTVCCTSKKLAKKNTHVNL